jgi:hypothetical protein
MVLTGKIFSSAGHRRAAGEGATMRALHAVIALASQNGLRARPRAEMPAQHCATIFSIFVYYFRKL